MNPVNSASQSTIIYSTPPSTASAASASATASAASASANVTTTAESVSKEAHEFFTHLNQEVDSFHYKEWEKTAIEILRKSSDAKKLATTTDSEGRTALHLLCCATHWWCDDLETELLKLGARPDIRDNAGWTPIHYSLHFKMSFINKHWPRCTQQLTTCYRPPAALESGFIQMIDTHTKNHLSVADVNRIIFDYSFNPVGHFINEIHQPANNAAAVSSVMEHAVFNPKTENTYGLNETIETIRTFKQIGGDPNTASVAMPNSSIKDAVSTMKRNSKTTFVTSDLTPEQLKRYNNCLSPYQRKLIETLKKTLKSDGSIPLLSSSMVKYILMGTPLQSDTLEASTNGKIFVFTDNDVPTVTKLIFSAWESLETNTFEANSSQKLGSGLVKKDEAVIYCRHITIHLHGPNSERYESNNYIQCSDIPKLAILVPRNLDKLSAVLEEDTSAAATSTAATAATATAASTKDNSDE